MAKATGSAPTLSSRSQRGSFDGQQSRREAYTKAAVRSSHGNQFADPERVSVGLGELRNSALMAKHYSGTGSHRGSPTGTTPLFLGSGAGTTLNPACLEMYLSDEDFQAALGMPKAQFYKLKQWKQREMKKRVALF